LTSLLIIDITLFIPAFHPFLARRNRPDGRANKTGEEWGIDEELRKLIESSAELRSLYAQLGYSPEVDRKVEQLLNDMKMLIRAEVPDFTAFQRAIREAQEQLNEQGQRILPPENLPQTSSEQSNYLLLQSVLEVENEQDKVLELLNRDPVYEQLPFIEQIPNYRDGQVIWRTPIEHSLIRKQPSDPDRFAQLIGETEELVKMKSFHRDRRLRKEVLEVTARLRQSLNSKNAYFPTPLKALEQKLTAWLHNKSGRTIQERKAQLDNFMRELISVRCKYAPDNTSRKPLRRSEPYKFKEAAQRHSKTYLEAPWMHTPWLTNYVLLNLLDSELDPLGKHTKRKPDSPAGVLQIVRDEVSSGRYDGEENIRRIRQQEEKDLYVHSFVYSLLRLHDIHQAT
jgi:hypothetical protein